jgi:hypothetical protein
MRLDLGLDLRVVEVEVAPAEELVLGIVKVIGLKDGDAGVDSTGKPIGLLSAKAILNVNVYVLRYETSFVTLFKPFVMF